jgi:hypothetical protein
MGNKVAGSPVGFSLERYRPMERLLSGEDLRFLRQAPGYSPKLGARWRKQQLRLVGMYLGELRRDFRELHREARAIVANSRQESPDLIRALVAQRVKFEFAAANLEMRILLAQCGLTNVNAAPIIALVESLRLDLSILAPKPMPVLVS